jgi:hypothetical protein
MIGKLFKKALRVTILLVLILALFTLPVMAAGAKGGDVPIVAEVSPEWYVIVFGTILSLAVSYIPGLDTWYQSQTTEFKKLFMAIGIFVILVVTFTLTCFGLITSNLTCSVNGGMNALLVYILTLGANQGTYGVSPMSARVKAFVQNKYANPA